MEQPAPQLSLRSPRVPPLPRLLQPFVHPQTFHPQGSANLCQLSSQEQPFPTPSTPQPSPKGLLMAPCGCRFDPNIFHIQKMTINLPSPAATTTLNYGAASLLGTASRGSQGCRNPPAWAAPGTFRDQPQHFTSFNLQGRAAVPAPPVLPPYFPGYQDMERRFAQLSLSETTTTTGSNISLGSNVLSHCADPPIQAIGNPASDLPLPKEMLGDCSLVSQDGPSRVPMPGYPGSTSRATSCYNIASLSLPAEMLTSDYSIPEASNSVLSLEQVNTIGIGPQEPWWDAGTNLPSPQLGRPEKRGQKRKSTFPDPPSKRRTLATCTRVGKWD